MARINKLSDIFIWCLCLNSHCKEFGKEDNNLFLQKNSFDDERLIKLLIRKMKKRGDHLTKGTSSKSHYHYKRPFAFSRPRKQPSNGITRS